MSNFYVEWASTVKARKGTMISLPALSRIVKIKDPGYSSVYMFKEEDALLIRQAGHSKGLNQYEVAAQFLVIDCDKGEKGRTVIEDILRERGLAYEIWTSGGKGYHFYIPHAFVVDKRLPASHKAAALALFPKDLIDITLYQHGRLLSLPNRIHPVTKKRKALISTIQGKPLELTIVDEAPKVMSFQTAETSIQSLIEGLQRSVDLMVYPPHAGQRHIRLWGTALDLARGGIEYDTALAILLKVNDTWDAPKTEEEITQAVNSAYRRLEQG